MVFVNMSFNWLEIEFGIDKIDILIGLCGVVVLMVVIGYMVN